MARNVQIPMDLFVQLIRYHYLEDDNPELLPAIRKGLEDKLEAIIRHETYSQYKDKALSPEEREQARQRYLDRIGMKDSFRWGEGENPLQPPT